jgi:hypothetical protein
MTAPTPTWRIHEEKENGKLLEVDVTPTQRIYIFVAEKMFGTPEMDAVIRMTVDAQLATHAIVNTPGEGE